MKSNRSARSRREAGSMRSACSWKIVLKSMNWMPVVL